MWFNKTKQKSVQRDTNKILAELFTDGIHLTINELIQYQSKASLINLTPGKNLHGRQSGNYLARSKGRGMEFDEVRHYQTGDDIRAIDWRVTARTGKTHTKLFREEVERPVLIATDLTASMFFGSQLLFKSVQAAHVASMVAWHAKTRGDRVGGIIFNQDQHLELKPRSRQQGVLHYLHTLTQLNNSNLASNIEKNRNTEGVDISFDRAKEGLAFEQNCARIRQLAKPGSLVYLITDANNLSQEALRHLTHVTRHCELVVCLISDPLEHQLPKSSKRINVAITDGEKRQQLVLGDNKTAKTYQEHAQLLLNEKENSLTKAGARLLHFCSSQSLEAQLRNGVVSWIR